MKINTCGTVKNAGEDWVLSDAAKEIMDGIANLITQSRGDCEVKGAKVIAYEFPINDRFIPITISVFERGWHPGEFVVNAYFGPRGGQQHPIPIVDKVSNAEQAIRAIQKSFNALLAGKMPEPD